MRAMLLAAALASAVIGEERGRLGKLGVDAFSAGRYRAAAAYLEKSIGLPEPGSRERRLLLARAYVELGDTGRADRVLRQALAVEPDSPELWHLFGQVQVVRGDKTAEVTLQRAITLGDSSAPLIASTARSDLAVVLQKAKRYSEAAKLLKEAIAADVPQQARARMMVNLADVRWSSGDRTEGLRLIAQAAIEIEKANGPNHPDLWRVLDAQARMLKASGLKAQSAEVRERADSLRSSLVAAPADWRELRAGR